MLDAEINTLIADGGPGQGWADWLPLSLASFIARDASSGAATTGAGFALDNSVFVAGHLGGSVDATGGLEASCPVPPNMFFGEPSGLRPKVAARIAARKVDLTGSATENADLALVVTLLVKPVGEAALTSLGSASFTLPAKTAATATDAYLNYTTPDLLASTSAANLAKITPGATLFFRVGVQEAVGTNLAVRIQHFEAQYLRDIRVQDRFELV